MKKTLKQKTIAVLGYGSQGHAHALNLRDSAYDVIVGLRKESAHRAEARKQKLKIFEPADAAQEADVIVFLVPDMCQPKLYEEGVKPFLKPGKTLVFAHGFNIHFKMIQPPKFVDVFLVAPKAPGPMVRAMYVEGKGVPMLYAVQQNPSGQAEHDAKEYAVAIGCLSGSLLKTTFREETETDLFGEQAVLCGGMTRLVMNGFETLVEAGYQPEVAYFECLHEMKLIVDLLQKSGMTGMRKAISETAQWGDYSVGDKVIDAQTKKRMKAILKNIQSGVFAKKWVQEYRSGLKHFYAYREKYSKHLMEKVGEKLRASMAKAHLFG